MTDRASDDRAPSALDRVVERGGHVLTTAREEGGAFGRSRRRQLEIILVIAAQAGLAAALAALLAARFGPGAHVFAPAAAVGTIATAIGQRVRRTLELLAGVGVGIVVTTCCAIWSARASCRPAWWSPWPLPPRCSLPGAVAPWSVRPAVRPC